MSGRAEELRRFAERAAPGRRVPVARVLPSDCLTPVLLFDAVAAFDHPRHRLLLLTVLDADRD